MSLRVYDCHVPIVIPAYEPDERLIEVVKQLISKKVSPIVIVDDGSGDEYRGIFKQIKEMNNSADVVIISHNVNRGKGRALKSAFLYILNTWPDAIGCVTADSDGQHSLKSICEVGATLNEYPNSLIMGVRDFHGEDIPWKSRIGNSLTEKVFRFVTGLHISDTQTGLRGIPISFMEELLQVSGERFEFETQMLLECVGKKTVIEVPIDTIYDSKEQHQTHFNPIKDSLKIYRVLAKKFLKYTFASISSAVIDIILFTLFCYVLAEHTGFYIVLATVLARILSAVYNYFLNCRIVFCSKKKYTISGVKYFLLASIQMFLSAGLVYTASVVFPFVPEVMTKIIIDTMLFFCSFYIQQIYVF